MRSCLLPFLILLSSSAHAIVNGDSTAWINSENERIVRQATVRILRVEKGKDVPFCSGVTSQPREVLGAGHCFNTSQDMQAVKEGRVFAEVYDPSKPNRIRRIRVRSVSYEKDDNTDISLMNLDEETPLKMSLPIAFSGCDQGSGYIASGYGIGKGNVPTREAQTAQYRDFTKTEFDQLIKMERLSDGPEPDKNWTVLRAVKGNVCTGDSGGPVFCQSKGKLAIAGISTNIASGAISLKPQNYKAEEYCKMAEMLQVNLLAAKLQKIEGWRNGGGSQQEAASAVKEP